jgi:hypothetical protein
MAVPFRNRLQALETRLGLLLRISAALCAFGSLVAILLIHNAQSPAVRVLGGISIVLWLSSAGIQIYGTLRHRSAKRSLDRPGS